jgi:voltage-gated potassium channel Kch
MLNKQRAASIFFKRPSFANTSKLSAKNVANYLRSNLKQRSNEDELTGPIYEYKNAVAKKWKSLSKKAILLSAGPSKLILPQSIVVIFESLETRTGLAVPPETQKLYYYEFSKMASPLGLVASSKMPILILSKLEIEVEQNVLQFLINKQTEAEDSAAFAAWDGSLGASQIEFSFDSFLHLISEIQDYNKTHHLFEYNGARKTSSWRNLVPIDPESSKKQAWDAFCMIVLLYCSFAVPYNIAFTKDDPDGLSTLDYLELAINAVFMVDIGLCFVTAYEDQGFMVKSLRSIARKYACSWLLLDFAGSFPFDLAIAATSAGHSAQSMSAMRLIRTLKLFRAVKFVNKLNKLKQREGYELLGSVLGIFSAVFILVFTAHLLGCVATLVLAADPDNNWLLHYNPALADAPDGVRYTTALYWATVSVTTMGYGDIVPVTHAERIMAILVALAGAVVFSHCMGTVSSLITPIIGVDDRCQDKFRSVAEYLLFRRVDGDLRRRVKRHYSACWRHSAAPHDERALLAELPGPLRAALLRGIGNSWRRAVPLLQGFDDECAGEVLAALQPACFEAGDVIYRRGEPAAEMYFVTEGAVELSVGASGPEAALGTAGAAAAAQRAGRGEAFGELGLFPELCGGVRAETAVVR